MLTFVASCIHWVLSGEIVVGSNSTASKFLNMNGSNKKRYSTSKQKNSFEDFFSNTMPLLEVKDEKNTKTISAGFDSKASIIRVKVKMTKQEAIRLLSKCKDGGVLGFRDVALELGDLPVNRINIMSPSPDSNAVLYNIPEEN